MVSRMLIKAARSETDVVCLPEQWQKQNKFDDFDKEFVRLRQIAKEYSMTIIPGAFYQKKKSGLVISAPVIDASGEIIGIQEKIHPFDYERDLINGGAKTRVFRTSCRFGIIICYDMVFSDVAESLVKKGAQVLFSPSRIVRRGIRPWHVYVHARSLENRVPILAANIQSGRFGGNSIIVDLVEDDGVMIPKTTTVHNQTTKSLSFDLLKYEKSRKRRYLDHRRFV
jgi:predicted amidohydrolase